MVLGDMYFIAISCHTIITTSASCDCVVLLAYQLRISYISTFGKPCDSGFVPIHENIHLQNYLSREIKSLNLAQSK